MSTKFPIGELARRSGVKVPTIRYYEQIGMLPLPPRTGGNRRLYTPADLQRLTFVRHGRELGFELDAIRALLALQEDQNQPCEVANSIARKHLVEVEQRIHSLQALKRELRAMLKSSRHGRVAQCRVIEVVADHGQCRTADHRPLQELPRRTVATRRTKAAAT